MLYQELLAKIDHTNLSHRATMAEIERLCKEALLYKVASVCIAPCYIKTFKARYPNLTFTTVVGFPNGYQTLETKLFETQEAILNGADEIDMVINLTNVSNKRWDLLEQEVKALRDATSKKVLKVIIETASLTDDEVIAVTNILMTTKVDYIKTSTGFYKAEDPYEKVVLIKNTIRANKSNLKIKVSGGIRTFEDVARYEGLEIERFGASRLLFDLVSKMKGNF